MGGTSFDACLIERGSPDVRGSVDVNHYRLAVPMVNINTIGAGGGSIAWIEHGLLRVGPQSAEVVPGPACYMRGGTQPTVTDADLVLGYLNQSALLGGRFKIDPLLAHSAIESGIAGPLGVSVAEAALGIYKIVNRNMAHAISEVSLERGYDPREFTLVAAGGQGALHAAELARELSITNVVIPRVASTFCAFGALAADLRHDYKRSFTCRLMDADLDQLRLLFEDMEQEGRADLLREGCAQADVAIVRHLEMRYVGQIFDVTVDVSTVDWSSDVHEALQELLHQQHEKEYTYRLEDAVAEVMNASVAAVGHLPELSLPLAKRHSKDTAGALRNRRRALIGQSGDYESIPIYDGTLLRPGNVLSGPAVVEEPNTTILVLPGFDIELTPVNAYVMRQVS
jgi:N-methylhydantoinase A